MLNDIDKQVIDPSLTCGNKWRIVNGFGCERGPVFVLIIYEGLFGLYDTNVNSGKEFSLGVNFLKWSTNDPNVGSVVSGHTNQSSDFLEIAVNKPISAVYGVNPYANLVVGYLKVSKFCLGWDKIKTQLLVVNGNFPFVVDLLFSNHKQFGKESS
jgi:hypothetical protein